MLEPSLQTAQCSDSSVDQVSIVTKPVTLSSPTASMMSTPLIILTAAAELVATCLTATSPMRTTIMRMMTTLPVPAAAGNPGTTSIDSTEESMSGTSVGAWVPLWAESMFSMLKNKNWMKLVSTWSQFESTCPSVGVHPIFFGLC